MIIADNTSQPPASRDHGSLTDHINIELNKCLQEAAEQHKAEENYFDRCHKTTNTLPEAQEVCAYSEADKETSIDTPSMETPESQGKDTGPVPILYDTEQDDCLSIIPEEDTEEEQDPVNQGTLVFHAESDQSDNEHFNTAVDTTSEDSIITMGQSLTTPFISDLVHILTEKVGCLQVTQTLGGYS